MVAWILAQADPEPEDLPAWRRIPLWLLGPIVRVIGWAQGASGPHDIDVDRLVPGVHPMHGFETNGVVVRARPMIPGGFRLLGFIGDGSITLDAAGTTEGAPVTGSFDGMWLQTDLSGL